MKITKLLLLNIIVLILGIVINFKYPNIKSILINYIMCSENIVNEYNFKDLISISVTINTIFIGFIATIATVFISMANHRVMNIINKFNKTIILIKSIKVALLSGIISLIAMAIIYVDFDFHNTNLRISLVWIIFNSLLIFIFESKCLIKIMKLITEQTLLGTDNIYK